MASPRNIHPRHQEDDYLSYGRSTRLESASYESNRTDLSVNSRDVVVADQWVVLGKIGEGSFGEVFEVRDINTKRHYAIKRETMKTKQPQLKFENVMYDVLAGGVGIPQCHWYGQFDGFDCIVMDLLGPNLNQVRENVSCMELDIAVDLVCQMVSIVEHMHNRGVIVRDVKPDNFLFPSNCHLPEMEMIESMDDYGMPVTTYNKPTCRQVFDEQWDESYPRLYAVDFGLACYWRDPETGVPYPGAKKHNKSKTGTARYASINVHRGKAHSRRDDMESIGYILLDLLLGTLPWTGVSAKSSKIGWDRMRQLKVDTVLADLCAGLPEGVLKFAEYPRSLQFADQPDYDMMRNFLKECFPGGTYSNLVKSPFGGEACPADNYNAIQQEREERQLKQQEKEQQQHYHHHCQPVNDNNRDDHTDMFAMDDLTNQLSATALSEPNPVHQPQQKHLASSQSSLYKLLKRNRAKKVGWNTHKHDVALWDPKTDWTNEEQSAQSLVKSWGVDDDRRTSGKWGWVPSTESKNSWQSDDFWGKQVRSDEGNDGLKQQQQQSTQKYNHRTVYSSTFSPRRGDPAQWTAMRRDSLGGHYQRPHPFSTNASSPYRQQQYSGKQRRHSQPHHHHQYHHHRRYSNPSKPAVTVQQPLESNTGNRRRFRGGADDDQSFQHQRHYNTDTDTFNYHRRPSHHRKHHHHQTNNSIREVGDRTKKNGPAITCDQKESPGAK